MPICDSDDQRTDPRARWIRKTDQNDVCVAGAFTPADAVDAGVVDERLEDEFCILVCWRGRKNSYHDGCGANRVPTDGDVVEVP